MPKGKSPKYKRVLLKISGEALQGKFKFGIDPEVADSIAAQIKKIHDDEVEIAIVIGGGNIFRGVKAASKGMDRSTADYMGMLATVINSLALQDALERHGVFTRVLSALEMDKVALGHSDIDAFVLAEGCPRSLLHTLGFTLEIGNGLPFTLLN